LIVDDVKLEELCKNSFGRHNVTFLELSKHTLSLLHSFRNQDPEPAPQDLFYAAANQKAQFGYMIKTVTAHH